MVVQIANFKLLYFISPIKMGRLGSVPLRLTHLWDPSRPGAVGKVGGVGAMTVFRPLDSEGCWDPIILIQTSEVCTRD